MANKIVLYKLIPTDGGLGMPPNIVNGGRIWEHSSNPNEIVFVGEMDSKLIGKDKLPDGIVEVITKTKLNKKFTSIAEQRAKKIKKGLYEKYCDPHFIEALKDREMGDEKKWKQYQKRVKKIKSLKTNDINEFTVLDFDDDLE